LAFLPKKCHVSNHFYRKKESGKNTKLFASPYYAFRVITVMLAATSASGGGDHHGFEGHRCL